MPSPQQLKLCLVSISLARGGAERSTALLSQILHNLGHRVHVIILNDEIDYEFSGEIFNLGKNKPRPDNFFHRMKRFRNFKKYLRRENFDCIIDNRTRSSAGKELFYSRYLYRREKVIYVVRSANLNEYFPENKFVANRMIQKSAALVGVSKYIKETLEQKYNTQKAYAIYNPAPDLEGIQFENENSKEKYILFVGRLEEPVKNLSLLLTAYQESRLIAENIRLKIIGDGPDRDFLIQKASALGIENHVDFIPFTSLVFPFYKNALFTVLTSRYEGFPRMLIESLACGTPVVSVDCVSGPREIISHGKNGLLVENFNPGKLADAMEKFIFDPELYQQCKENSRKSIAHLNQKEIATTWNNVLLNLK